MDKHKRRYKHIEKAVRLVNEEYFNSFIIFANDPQGNIFVIPNIQTKVDELALLSMINKFQETVNVANLIQDDMDNLPNLDD